MGTATKPTSSSSPSVKDSQRRVKSTTLPPRDLPPQLLDSRPLATSSTLPCPSPATLSSLLSPRLIRTRRPTTFSELSGSTSATRVEERSAPPRRLKRRRIELREQYVDAC